MNQYQYKQTYRPPKKQKDPINKSIIIGFLIITLIFNTVYRGIQNKKPVDPDNTNPIKFEVSSGDSLEKISNNLKDVNLINSSKYFKKLSKQKDLDKSIPIGITHLNQSMTPLQVLNAITSPDNSQTKVTILEGWNTKQIDNKLSELNLIQPGEFLKCLKECDISRFNFIPENSINSNYPLEGYLYPDTYFVKKNTFKPESLLKKMLSNFEQKMYTQFPDISRQKRSMQEIIIMASILEKEVRLYKDMQIVAGILWKRLDSRWAIGADATLLYEKDNNIITKSDINSNSLYNTRKLLGLPPTPIANPSAEAIKASINPTATNFWFYLTTLDTGKVIYANSNEEHNQNKYKYLK